MSSTGQLGTTDGRSARGQRSRQNFGKVFKRRNDRRGCGPVKPAAPSQLVVSEVEDVMNDMMNAVEIECSSIYQQDTPGMSFVKTDANSAPQPPPIFPTKLHQCSPYFHCTYWPACNPYLMIHNLCPPAELPHD